MIRKTLTILSLLHLLFFVGLWGATLAMPTYLRARIPLWIPTLLFAALSYMLIVPVHRRRKRKKLGLCLECGYDLRGSKGTCPECGTEFETT